MTDEVQKINDTTDRILKTSDEILKMLQKMLEQTIEFEKNFLEIINREVNWQNASF